MENAHSDRNEAARRARVLCFGMALSLIAMGCVSALVLREDLVAGMCRILTSRAVLFSDYFVIGGIGAAFLNAGAVMLLSIGLVEVTDTPYNGGTVAALFLLPGFALFGKDIINIQPFFLGVYLYSAYARQPMRRNVAAALYSTTLSPIVSELLWNIPLPLPLRLLLGFAAGTLIGFAIVPMAMHTVKLHHGYVMFNMGFASGFFAYMAYALLLALGTSVAPGKDWLSGRTPIIAVFLLLLCAVLLIAGAVLGALRRDRLRALFSMTGRIPHNNTIAEAGIGAALLNMGAMGLCSIAYIYLIGGDLSGPVVGAILTVIGFAASGVHPRSFLPVLLGVWLFSRFGAYPTTAYGVQIAALFGAVALAPIAGQFGPVAGVIAGMLHYALVTVTGAPTGGLNLYNNGFAAGIVAMILITLAEAFNKRVTRFGKLAGRLFAPFIDTSPKGEEHEEHSGYYGA